MSRTPIPGYAQFLLKTLLKNVGRSGESDTNPNVLAICTIVVRPVSVEIQMRERQTQIILTEVVLRCRLFNHTAYRLHISGNAIENCYR